MQVASHGASVVAALAALIGPNDCCLGPANVASVAIAMPSSTPGVCVHLPSLTILSLPMLVCVHLLPFLKTCAVPPWLCGAQVLRCVCFLLDF